MVINSYNLICALTLFIALLSLAKHSIRKHLFSPLTSVSRIHKIVSSATKPLLRSSSFDSSLDIPGPPLARWTNLWLLWHARMGKRYLAVDEAHEVSRSFNSSTFITTTPPENDSFFINLFVIKAPFLLIRDHNLIRSFFHVPFIYHALHDLRNSNLDLKFTISFLSHLRNTVPLYTFPPTTFQYPIRPTSLTFSLKGHMH